MLLGDNAASPVEK